MRAAVVPAKPQRPPPQLYGKRGELNGAVLDDGTILRLPPREASRLSNALRTGESVTVRGERRTTPLGAWIDARAIGASADQMSDVAPPPPPPHGHPAPPPPRR